MTRYRFMMGGNYKEIGRLTFYVLAESMQEAHSTANKILHSLEDQKPHGVSLVIDPAVTVSGLELSLELFGNGVPEYDISAVNIIPLDDADMPSVDGFPVNTRVKRSKRYLSAYGGKQLAESESERGTVVGVDSTKHCMLVIWDKNVHSRCVCPTDRIDIA